jgi:multiple sugar transport system permease protein
VTPGGRPWLRTAVATLITAVFLLPVYWMVNTSLTEPDRIQADTPRWLPVPVTTENYSTALAADALPRALLNSVVISCGVVALTLLLGVPLSYALARIPMRGSGTMVLALLVAQLPPSIVLAAPLFILERRAGLDDTHLGLIAADTTLTLPFAVIVLRPLLRSVPRELEEAALVDGCASSCRSWCPACSRWPGWPSSSAGASSSSASPSPRSPPYSPSPSCSTPSWAGTAPRGEP